MKKNILVTCPPMIKSIDTLASEFEKNNWKVFAADVIQTLSEEELVDLLPNYDGWIIGDDPVTEPVLRAGLSGCLKAAVKWGIGTDNVDKSACEALNFTIPNTPNMFGAEVADIALCYVIGLARDLFYIDRNVRTGEWTKPAGVSLAGKTAALIGYGDIGKNTATRLISCGVKIIAYDPIASLEGFSEKIELAAWPDKLDKADFVIVTCSLNAETKHMVNRKALALMKRGVRIVNVSRGPIINERDLVEALTSGKVSSVALDVFESEPLDPIETP